MKNFYRDSGLAITVIVLVIALLTLMGYVYSVSTKLFWAAAPFIVLSAGFAIGKLITVTRKNFHYFAFMAERIDSINKIALDDMPLAVSIMDANNKIIWFNKSFKEQFEKIAVYGNPISEITDIDIEKLKNSVSEVMYEDEYYETGIFLTSEENAEGIHLIYFKNITVRKHLEIEKKLSHPVVMLIMVDNYDDMFDSNLESEKAHVTVKIDKLLEDFISGTSGIMKKFNRDRTWAVIEQRHINKLIEDKVKLLDKAREIAVSDRIYVTLSIGIGTGARDLAESEQFARQALEMAQGRGGDQAAVKTLNGFEFYGGISKGVERQTKVKARIIANSLIKLIEDSDCVYIMGHKISDLDSIGAAVGLASAIRNLGKSAYVAVEKTASLGVELIEKMKTADFKPPLFVIPSKACETFTPDSLLIIVDTHNPMLLEDAELYAMSQKTVVIDHHRKMVNHINNALIFHHEAYSSSASEMVTELIQYFGDAGRITALQAEALLAGIMLDTKSFTIKTGVRTFEAAAFLRKLGADTINVKVLFNNSFENYKQKVVLVASSKIYKRCAIACSDILSDTMRLVAPQTADELLTVSNIDASFVVYRTLQNEVYISARSYGAMNVQLVMEALGGGGHHTMAGAQFKDISVSEAEGKLISSIDAYYSSQSTESD